MVSVPIYCVPGRGPRTVIDIRYHLASMVAIFFALGLGMLTGAQLADDGALAQEHARLIQQIEEGLERVRTDNRRLAEQLAAVRGQLAEEKAFVDDVLGQLVAGRLAGIRVRLVAQDESLPYVERVRSALTRAGADVSVGRLDVPDPAGSPEDATVFLGRRAPWEGAEGFWSTAEDFSDVPTVGDVDTIRGLLKLVETLATGAAFVAWGRPGGGT